MDPDQKTAPASGSTLYVEGVSKTLQQTIKADNFLLYLAL